MAQENRAKSIAGSGNGPITYICTAAAVADDDALTAMIEEWGMKHTIAAISGTADGGAMAFMLQGGPTPDTTPGGVNTVNAHTFVSA